MTIALVVAIVVLFGIGIFEIWYLNDDADRDGLGRAPGGHRRAQPPHARWTRRPARPSEILSTSYENYDEQVDEATAKMTDSFAEEYRETAEGIQDRFVEQQTKLQSRWSARASCRRRRSRCRRCCS